MSATIVLKILDSGEILAEVAHNGARQKIAAPRGTTLADLPFWIAEPLAAKIATQAEADATKLAKSRGELHTKVFNGVTHDHGFLFAKKILGEPIPRSEVVRVAKSYTGLREREAAKAAGKSRKSRTIGPIDLSLEL